MRNSSSASRDSTVITPSPSPQASPNVLTTALRGLAPRAWPFRSSHDEQRPVSGLDIQRETQSMEVVFMPGLGLQIQTDVSQVEPPAYSLSPIEISMPSPRRSVDALTDEEAELLDNDNMAWGPPSPSSRKKPTIPNRLD